MHNDTINPDHILINTVFTSKNGGPAGVRIFANPDAPGYVLEWTDFVANDWREEFSTLSSVLARAALLAHCAGTDWVAGTKDSAEEHDERWSKFAAEATN